MSLNRSPSPAVRHGVGWPLLAALAAGALCVVTGVFVFANPLGGSDGPELNRYTEAIVGAPQRVNPLFVHFSDVDRDISSLVFSGLTRLDKDGTPVPDLAEDWEVSDDGLQVTFNLRSGISWHTGPALTSDDVLFTFGLLADPTLPGDPEQATLWQSIDCTAPDSLTVVCALPEPYAPFLAYASIGILPRHVLESVTATGLAEDPFNRAPVGTGPYRLSQLNTDRAILRANDEYHFGRPAIDEIEMLFYPDIATAAADILRGEAQGLLVDLSIDPADFQALRAVDRFEAHSAGRSAYTSLYLNNTEAPLDEQPVRLAVSLALDIDSILTSLVSGRGVRTDTPIVPGTWAFDDDIPQRPHDLGEARTVLEDAGWRLPADATVREKDGTELRLTLITDQDALRGAVADAIAGQLADVGIETAVVRQPSNDLVSEYLIPRRYQAAIFGWDAGADPDPYPAWHSSQALEGGRNLAGYTSDEADEIMEEARRTTDMADRKALYEDFQRLFIEDMPSVPLFSPLYTYFVTDQVRGIDAGVLFTPAARFRNVIEWRLERSQGIGG